MIPTDPGEIFRESRERIEWYKIRSLFRAEHQVNQDVRIFVGHDTNMHVLELRVCDECTIQAVPSRNGPRSSESESRRDGTRPGQFFVARRVFWPPGHRKSIASAISLRYA